MRVTEKDDQLILRTPWSNLLGAFILVLFWIFPAGAVLWTYAHETTLTCRLEVAELRCQITQTRLGQVINRVEVVNPQQAIVQSRRDSKGSTSYRMELVTTQGTIPFTGFYLDDTEINSLAAQFNQFKHNPTVESVTLREPINGDLPLILFSLISGGAGLHTILTTYYDTFTFDRRRDMLTYTRLGFRGRRTREEALTGLKTEVHQHRGSKGRRFYRVHLVLATGDEIKVDWNTSRDAAAQDVADRVQEFIRPGTHIKYANA